MNKNTSANTLRYQDVSLGQEGIMKMVSADMVIQEYAYISKQEGVKREKTVIFTMEEKEIATGHQLHTLKRVQIMNFPMITMEIGEMLMFRL